MKIMLDTNVLISALVFGGMSQKLLGDLLLLGQELYVSEYVDAEFREKIHQKWPDREKRLFEYYENISFTRCQSTKERLGSVRDEKDVPVLSDAIVNHMDVLLTGDKDFLESNIDYPLIFSPRMLSEYLEHGL